MTIRSERRTVHPVITQAIVDGLGRAALRPPGLDEVRSTVDQGLPVDERTHRRLKQFLFDHGRPWDSFDTGWRFARTTEHPLLSLLTRSRSPAELIHRARRLEPLLHLGNRTVITLGPNEFRVSHQGNRGIAPTPGESLFVCGAQCGALERIGATGVQATTTERPVVVWPVLERSIRRPTSCQAWTITWASAPTAPNPPTTGVLADDVLSLVTDQPEQPWTVESIARHFAMSPRSLQRTLQQQDAELRALIRLGRVEAARALLARTDIPISVVAYLCGFSDASHLANVTRALLNTTPSQLRSQAIAA